MADIDVPQDFEEFETRLKIVKDFGPEALKERIRSQGLGVATKEDVMSALFGVLNQAFTITLPKGVQLTYTLLKEELQPRVPEPDPKKTLEQRGPTAGESVAPPPAWMNNLEIQAIAQQIANDINNKGNITNNFNDFVNKLNANEQLKNELKLRMRNAPRPGSAPKLKPEGY